MVKETFPLSDVASVHVIALAVFLSLFPVSAATGQAQGARDETSNAPSSAGRRVHVDCVECEDDYLRTELTFVDLVRDRQLADVAVLVTSLRTASGGRQFSIQTRVGGRMDSSAMSPRADTLHLNIRPDATIHEQRQALVRAIKVALLPWIRESLELAHLDLQYTPPRASRVAADRPRDPWNQWVFRVGGSGSFARDDNFRSGGGDANLRASRITDALKLEWLNEGQYQRERFRLSDSTFAVSIRQSWSTRVFVAQSLGPHWSAGLRGSVASSIFQNTRVDSRTSLALEYSPFPYREATQRQVIVRYTVGLRAARYVDTTVFGLLRETRPLQDLAMATDIRQPWGNVYGSAVWSQYLHDGRRRRLTLEVGIDYRILAGLNLGAGLNYARIRDQLNVPGANLTDQERLLQLRELQSGSSASLSVGLSYTFGSVFSNVVNPRFRL
jgi:hypothetical protein